MHLRIEVTFGRDPARHDAGPDDKPHQLTEVHDPSELMAARIEAAYRNLDQVIGWIGNADNKALILLAIHGAMIAGAAAIGPTAIEPLHERTANWVLGVALVPIVAFGICVTWSLILATRAISPDVTTSEQQIGRNSPFFFGSVAGMTVDEFRTRMCTLNLHDIEEELIKNTYVVAGIAGRKFRDVRMAVRLIRLAWMFLIMAIVTLGAVAVMADSPSNPKGTDNASSYYHTKLPATVR